MTTFGTRSTRLFGRLLAVGILAASTAALAQTGAAQAKPIPKLKPGALYYRVELLQPGLPKQVWTAPLVDGKRWSPPITMKGLRSIKFTLDCSPDGDSGVKYSDFVILQDGLTKGNIEVGSGAYLPIGEHFRVNITRNLSDGAADVITGAADSTDRIAWDEIFPWPNTLAVIDVTVGRWNRSADNKPQRTILMNVSLTRDGKVVGAATVTSIVGDLATIALPAGQDPVVRLKLLPTITKDGAIRLNVGVHGGASPTRPTTSGSDDGKWSLSFAPGAKTPVPKIKASPGDYTVSCTFSEAPAKGK